ncbi:MAG: NTP transferase domain-containing protein [Armatimonadota bacterium]|nr:NTP transferase domain-containing protein [Armatimonadota bacterium]MCX7777855.1 NTP transferase domain-containing protein [Armatimonadota bacterium]MDW8025847.1 NTP transferase domain-containing protein [Armatimonadota bacterium]
MAHSIDAIVLAGGVGDDVARAENVLSKVAVNICGEPLLLRVIKAMHDAITVRNIVVVTQPQLGELILNLSDQRIHLVHDAGSLWENVNCAINSLLEPSDMLLFAAGDTPFLRGELLDAFVEDGLSSGADIVYPIVSKAAYERTFIGCKRTFVRLRDGIFTGGNCMLIRWRILGSVSEVAKAAIAARKKPWQLARILGWKTLLKMPFGLLTIDELKSRAEHMLKCRIFVLVTDAAELAFDIDEVRHLEHARRVCTQFSNPS